MSIRRLSLPLLVSTCAIAATADAAVIKVTKAGPLTTIQAGVNAASPGDVVQVAAGTYAETVTIDANRAGITLTAKGKVVLDALGPQGVGQGPAITVDAPVVRIKGLRIQNAVSTMNADGIGILASANGVRIEKCSVMTCEVAGMSLTAPDALVSKCAFTSMLSALLLDGADGARIERCSMRGVPSAVRVISGIAVTVDRLDVRSSDQPVHVDGANAAAFVVRDSKFTGVSDECVIVDSPNAFLERNRFRAVGAGIVVSGDSAVIRDNVMEFVSSFGFGIAISNGSGSTVEGNVLRDCATGAIDLDSSSSSATLRDNVVIRAGDDGFVAYGVDGTNHILEDERVFASGGDAFRVAGTDHELFDCIARDSAIDGFDVGSTATFVSLDRCDARRCAGEGLENSGSLTNFNECTAFDNRIDFVNDGTFVVTAVTFATGGAQVAPQID